MVIAIAIAAVLSIQLLSVHSDTVEKCIEGNHHKKVPSAEPSGFVTCFPWQNRSCCSPEVTVELKEYGGKHMYHIDWDHCGGLSEACRQYMVKSQCLYFCDPNVVKFQTSGAYIRRLPFCSNTCNEWFKACKNDKTYSENWLDDYAVYHELKGAIKPHRPCRTYAEIFKNGEGLCNKLWGLSFKYELSSNCMVFDFEGENPNDKVMGPN